MITTKKEKLPIQHLRRTVFLSKETPQSSLGIFKYLPMAIHTSLSTIPMPWEHKKMVTLAYHHTGNLTLITSKPKINENEFRRRWSYINGKMKVNKNVRCLSFPIFDDDEPFIEYTKIQNETPNNDFTNSDVGAFEPSDGKKKNFYDIPLYKSEYLSHISTTKTSRLSKNHAKNLKKSKTKSPHTNIVKLLKNTRYFHITETDWLEATLQILYQGHKVLDEILRRKRITYLYVDYNFNLRNTRPLTTKERKKSRVGTSFHLTREILKLLKYVADSHISFRLGHISEYDLCGTLRYLFNNVGIVTGIYRYKYRTMKQIKMCKALEEIADAYSDNSWCEMWRVFVFMMRGYNSLLKVYISSLVTRIVNGREDRPKKVTKQRVESNYDIGIKNQMISELSNKFSRVQVVSVLKHFNEAWKCWKSHKVYQVNISDEDMCCYVQSVIDKYVDIKASWYVDEALSSKKTKKDRRKKLGKISRLYFKNEATRQIEYLEQPYLSPVEAISVYKATSQYFKSKGSPFIEFIDKNEEKHLINAVDRLRSTATEMEKEFYEKVAGNMTYYINLIKKQIITQRTFREIGAKLTIKSTKYVPCYEISYLERLADGFLASYLFYESERVGIFPDYIGPNDDIDIRNISKISATIAKKASTDSVLYECEYKNIMERMDINLLLKLLRIILDPILVDYIIARNNCRIGYKDIEYSNNVGFIKGFLFSPFVYKYYSLVVDLIIFGTSVVNGKSDLVRFFYRDLGKAYVLLDLDNDERRRIADIYGKYEVELTPDINYFDNKLASDTTTRNDELRLSKSIHLEFATRMPSSIGYLKFIRAACFPRIKFTFAGVDIFIGHQINQRSYWQLSKGLFINLAISFNELKTIESRISDIVETSTACTFLKVVTKWNNMLLGFLSHYRELISDSEDVFKVLDEGERKIQRIIKQGINTKMPVRFPPQLFYTPSEYGGLGMFCFSDSMFKDDNIVIPKLIDYIDPWTVEFEESDRVWKEFARSGHIELNKGVPRMNTLLQKNKSVIYDRSYRLLSKFKKYWYPRYDPFYYTDLRHDGQLWDIKGYFADVVESFGGKDEILNHTLFSATCARKFDKLFWTPADTKTKLTKAQKVGVNQIPNRRFILWWSPTINRANVYVGYQVQLDPTGISMHGKLPTLKMSFVQVFRNNLWCKIHESVVSDLQNVLKRYGDVKRMDVPPRKSVKFSVGCADLYITSNFYMGDPQSIEIAHSRDSELTNVKCLWVDLQIRWGDYDRRDVSKYARTKYVEYISNPLSKYEGKGFVIGVDLCYNTYSAYGYIDPSLSQIVQSAMAHILKTNLSLHILRERLRKTLQVYSSETESIMDAKDMFGNVLVLDERLIYSSTKTYCVFDPETGNFYYKKIRKDEGKKAKTLRNYICEDVFVLAESLNKEVILVRDDMVDFMQNYVVDHPSIKLKTYNCRINFSKIIKIDNLSDISEDKFGVINVYRSWFGTTMFTNFCRLVLILQAYSVDDQWFIGTGFKSFRTVLQDKEWISLEKRMRDVIVNHYCAVNMIKSCALSQSETRNIVFGFPVDHKTSISIKPQAVEQSGDGFYDCDEYHITNKFLVEGRYNEISIEYGEECDEKRSLSMNLFRVFKATVSQTKYVFSVLVESGGSISMAFLPQFSTDNEIFSSTYVPEGIKFVGVMINTDDHGVISRILNRYKIISPILAVYKNNAFKIDGCKVSDTEACVYVPEIWNYAYMKEYFYDDLEYELRIGLPCEYYCGNHMMSRICGFYGKHLEDVSFRK